MKTAQFIFGSLLLALGLGLLAEQFVDYPVLSYAIPIVLLVIGFTLLMRNLRMLGGFVLLLGALILLATVVGTSFWVILWPMLIILVGVLLLTSQFSKSSTKNGSAENDINVTSFFSERIERSTAKAFSGGKIVSGFGSTKIDLREAKFTPNAKLNITSFFGAVEVRVPRGVAVTTDGVPMFGSFRVDHQSANETAKLKVEGVALFGEVRITD